MVNITISEASGQFKQLYGDIQVPLASFIEEQEAKDRANCLALKIFSERTSTNFAEGYGGLTAAGEMQPVGEGGNPPANSFAQRELKIIENETWKSRMQITREIIDDAHGDMKRIIQRAGAAKLTSGYYRTIDNFLMGLLGAALGGKDKYTVGGRDYATTCYDGKCVFSKTHKSGSKTYCNMYADAFSKDVLGKLSTVQQNVKDESGAALGIAPDTILIPNDYATKKTVFEAIGSEKDPGSANNGFNYLFGQWNVIIHPALNALIPASGAVPFILLDSKYNERNDGNVFQNRVSLEVESHEDKDTKNNVWDAYTRFSGGFVDFRHMIAGGVTGGETL